MIEKRKCFGTTEYNKTNGMCKACRDYEQCSVMPKIRKLGMSTRRFRDYKYYNV